VLLRPLAAALVASAALPVAAAGRPSLHVDHRCYTVGDPVHVTGSGFPQSSSVAFTLLGKPYGAAVTDAKGRLLAENGIAPSIAQPFRQVRLRARSAGATATTRFSITRLTVAIRPRRVESPTDVVTFRARGFARGRRLYLHYITPRGHALKPRRLGRTRQPCGTRTAKAPLIDSPDPRTGRWRLQFDTHRKYSSKTRPRVRLAVRVS
jgi:hypothetical protein